MIRVLDQQTNLNINRSEINAGRFIFKNHISNSFLCIKCQKEKLQNR